MIRAGWINADDHITERDVDFARKGFRKGFRWALTSPNTRDLFGSSATFSAGAHTGPIRISPQESSQE